ncbi:MAG: beta-galactosidase [Bacteroidales bacterium]|nr:beta-galactosidase [Bacteroidales bacterium]
MKNRLLTTNFAVFLLLLLLHPFNSFSFDKPKELLYGAAYYYEYMPTERLEEDVRLMKECGINYVRIGESTWGYTEPQDGVFNTEWLIKVLDAMHKAEIKVIVGTPTYALPTWLAKKHPEILLETRDGKSRYGHRQNMDITHPVYRFYAERVIRKMMEAVCDHPAVIGYQLDNETKHYGNANENVQLQFVKYLKQKFTSPEEMTKAYGLHYWSNSVFAWEDMPSTIGAVNASLGCSFEQFRRSLVTDFLAWQASIVNEYKRKDQFTTQNFDLDWRNGSYGIQPNVDHFEAAKSIDIAGIDIYHQTQDKLDGIAIAFAGDIARSMKQDNYFVLETEAQSIINSATQQLPYPGQLRLQAFSHLASGANMVAYWPWHSIHNSVETYWKGVLSHDMQPNPTYYEAQKIAGEFKRLTPSLINLKKHNKVAVYFSNESLSALSWFPFSYTRSYNDLIHQLYESLYKMNIECDFIDHTADDLSKYKLIVIPALYVTTDKELQKLNDFVESGGNVVYTFKSGFCNENLQVRMDTQPARLTDVCGVTYQQFTNVDRIALKENQYTIDPDADYMSEWIELVTPVTAEVWASYDHPYWGKYAAVTHNKFGKGTATYIAGYPSKEVTKQVLDKVVTLCGLKTDDNKYSFPVIIRTGENEKKKTVRYYLNYSSVPVTVEYSHNNAKELLSDKNIKKGDSFTILAWDLAIFEER